MAGRYGQETQEQVAAARGALELAASQGHSSMTGLAQAHAMLALVYVLQDIEFHLRDLDALVRVLGDQ